jgi:hypothetical protein
MTDQELYRKCRETVANVEALQDLRTVRQKLGEPVQVLPIGDFFITNSDRSVTYCDIVELHHFDDCAIRIGYIEQRIVKVRGMPLAHWKPPSENA